MFDQAVATLAGKQLADEAKLRCLPRAGVDPYLLFLDRPTPGATPPRPPPANLTAALAAYRAGGVRCHGAWELRGACSRIEPRNVRLDEMYVPLRFDPELRHARYDLGAAFSPDDVATLAHPRVLIGHAGSGKTTWVQWTFRQLAARSDVVPFFLELRTLARQAALAGHGWSLESHLAAALDPGELRGDGRTVAEALFTDDRQPRPVLLVDGWDELGEQGRRFRAELDRFLGAHPRVAVVVTSRPYGCGLPGTSAPSHASRFDVVQVQPLSGGEIRRLVDNYHHFVHGEDDVAAAAHTARFLDELGHVPEAQELVRDPLHLTMMLLLHHTEPIPDRRHILYQRCLDLLLSTRPAEKARSGAQLQTEEVAPATTAEARRVLAALAFSIQAEGYRTQSRIEIVRSEAELLRMLPADWDPERQRGFLRWLVLTAGVLVDRSDDSYCFAHLSFQEYLAALHLHKTREDRDRATVVPTFAHDRDWWETLRLWAALVSDDEPARLDGIIAAIGPFDDAFWLGGAMLADGGAGRDGFAAWSARLVQAITHHGSCEVAAGAQSWVGSSHDARRRALGGVLGTAASAASHDAAARLHEWCERAGIAAAPPKTGPRQHDEAPRLPAATGV